MQLDRDAEPTINNLSKSECYRCKAWYNCKGAFSSTNCGEEKSSDSEKSY